MHHSIIIKPIHVQISKFLKFVSGYIMFWMDLTKLIIVFARTALICISVTNLLQVYGRPNRILSLRVSWSNHAFCAAYAILEPLKIKKKMFSIDWLIVGCITFSGKYFMLIQVKNKFNNYQNLIMFTRPGFWWIFI